jgi:hypothetical protein
MSADGEADLQDTAGAVADLEMRRDEERALRYSPACNRWELEIEQPIVGYMYQLRWRLPGEEQDVAQAGETMDRQAQLLEMGERVAAGRRTEADKHAEALFEVLCGALAQLLGDPGTQERRAVEIYAYHQASTSLRPVLSYRSWSSEPLAREFAIPLGAGIAGAAFQQRRIVPWIASYNTSPFLQPVPYPWEPEGEPPDLGGVLAVPVYLHALSEEKRPPPWATIGVVCFTSSARGGRIAELCNRKLTGENEALLREVRALSQSHVRAILETLRRQNPVDRVEAGGF